MKESLKKVLTITVENTLEVVDDTTSEEIEVMARMIACALRQEENVWLPLFGGKRTLYWRQIQGGQALGIFGPEEQGYPRIVECLESGEVFQREAVGLDAIAVCELFKLILSQ